MTQEITISFSSWLLWTWVPAGIVGGLLELWVLRVTNRWEYGEKRKVGWTWGSWVQCGLMGWIMVFRMLFLPLVLLGAWRERGYRLADERAMARHRERREQGV